MVPDQMVWNPDLDHINHLCHTAEIEIENQPWYQSFTRKFTSIDKKYATTSYRFVFYDKRLLLESAKVSILFSGLFISKNT